MCVPLPADYGVLALLGSIMNHDISLPSRSAVELQSHIFSELSVENAFDSSNKLGQNY